MFLVALGTGAVISMYYHSKKDLYHECKITNGNTSAYSIVPTDKGTMMDAINHGIIQCNLTTKKMCVVETCDIKEKSDLYVAPSPISLPPSDDPNEAEYRI